MILQRLYSRTHTDIKTARARRKKAKELLEVRKKIDKRFNLQDRLDEIHNEYMADLEKIARGESNAPGKGKERFREPEELLGIKKNSTKRARTFYKEVYNEEAKDLMDNTSRRKMSEEATKARLERERIAKEKAEKESKTIKGRLSKAKEGAKKFVKKNKKGLIIGGGVAAASGLTYGGVKAYKHYKDKKNSEDLRKKVSGYDNSKKKKS